MRRHVATLRAQDEHDGVRITRVAIGDPPTMASALIGDCIAAEEGPVVIQMLTTISATVSSEEEQHGGEHV